MRCLGSTRQLHGLRPRRYSYELSGRVLGFESEPERLSAPHHVTIHAHDLEVFTDRWHDILGGSGETCADEEDMAEYHEMCCKLDWWALQSTIERLHNFRSFGTLHGWTRCSVCRDTSNSRWLEAGRCGVQGQCQRSETSTDSSTQHHRIDSASSCRGSGHSQPKLLQSCSDLRINVSTPSISASRRPNSTR